MNRLVKILISLVPGKTNRLLLNKKLFFFGYPLKAYPLILRRLFNSGKINTNSTKTDKVVYTVITGTYNDLITPLCYEQDWNYICFTNNEDLLKNGHPFWKIQPIKSETELDDQKKSRLPKILTHKFLSEYKYSIYVDANIDIISDKIYRKAEELIKNGKKLAITKHFCRDCLYDEREVCIKKGKDTVENTEKQIEIFRKDGFPAHYGLKENNIIFREHNSPEIIKIMEDWWFWLANYSKRDQLSLMYVLWKNNYGTVTDIFEKPVRKMHKDIILRVHNK